MRSCARSSYSVAVSAVFLSCIRASAARATTCRSVEVHPHLQLYSLVPALPNVDW